MIALLEAKAAGLWSRKNIANNVLAGVVVGVLDKVYAVGRKYAEGFKKNMKIRFDDFLPKWNYCAIPATS